MFRIHPADFAQRRARCRPVLERLDVLPREAQPACNLCGSPQHVVLADHDRYGFPTRTAMCLRCGLIYMVDRFTDGGYAEFYGSGAYRSISCAFNGTPAHLEQIESDQVAYAAHTVRVLEGHVRSGPLTQLLDVGGSTGVVAREFAKHFGLSATVLDPAAREIAAARALGLNAVLGSVETYDTAQRFDVILLCRSIEHLCDLRESLAKIRELLKPGGVFYCDVIDFLESCRMLGAPQVVGKMDHCYWLCQETAPAIFRAAGLEVVSANISLEPAVVGYLLRRAEPVPIDAPSPSIGLILRRLREIDADWREYGKAPRGWRDRVRRAAYQLRRYVRHGVLAMRTRLGAGRTPRTAGLVAVFQMLQTLWMD